MNYPIKMHHNISVSLYWDYENVRFPHHAKQLLTLAHSLGKLKNTRVYARWRKENQPSEMTLHELGIDCIDIPSNFKNSLDEKLISDCFREFTSNSSASVLVLITGDKDYELLAREMQARGVRVIIVANPRNANRKLLRAVSEEDLYYVDQLPANRELLR